MYPVKPQNIFAILIIFLVTMINGHQTAAQSSLFNIPTTDVLSAGETYLEADFDSHLTGYQRGGFQSFGGMAIYGLKKKMEVGLNMYYTKTGEPKQPIELQPNVKFQLYNSEGKGIAAAAGTILYIPITNRRGIDTFGSVYVTVSKTFRGKYGPRLTTGGYALIGRDKETGNRKGALFGFEQPLHKGISFIADWNTGKNRFGYAAAGLGFTLSKRNFLYTAYYFGNEGRGNNSLGVYYGFTF